MAWVPYAIMAVGAVIKYGQAKKNAKAAGAAALEQRKYDSETMMINARLIEQQAQANAMISFAMAGSYKAIGDGIMKVGQINARLARDAAYFNADEIRRKGKKIISTQIATYGKSGVTMQGTPTEVVVDTGAEIEFDAMISEYGGDVDALKHMMDASINAQQMYNQAKMSTFQGQMSIYTGGLEARNLRINADRNLRFGLTESQNITRAGISEARSGLITSAIDIGASAYGGLKAPRSQYGVVSGGGPVPGGSAYPPSPRVGASPLRRSPAPRNPSGPGYTPMR